MKSDVDVRGAQATRAKLAISMPMLVLLASCGGGGGRVEPGVRAPGGATEVSDYPVKIGQPYKIGSQTYTPVDVASYDEVGYASWYGREHEGRPTANGETFRADWITAAHKTLPLPTYAEVTSLDTGKTILVRINDRGPFSNGKLIDLSEGAARQLGIMGKGVSGVRVRKVNPVEQERAVLRSGGQAAERIETPDSLLRVLRNKLAELPRPSADEMAAPAPARSEPAPRTSDGRFIIEGRDGPRAAAPSRPAPPSAAKPSRPASRPSAASSDLPPGYEPSVPARAVPETAPVPPRAPREKAVATSGGGDYVVQVAAFSSRSRADQLARRIGAKVTRGGGVYRVRYGPYASESAARDGIAKARRNGFAGAQILRD